MYKSCSPVSVNEELDGHIKEEIEKPSKKPKLMVKRNVFWMPQENFYYNSSLLLPCLFKY